MIIFNKAIVRFFSMVDNCNKSSGLFEVEVVYKYGKNLLKTFKDVENSEIYEVQEKLDYISSLISFRKEGI